MRTATLYLSGKKLCDLTDVDFTVTPSEAPPAFPIGQVEGTIEVKVTPVSDAAIGAYLDQLEHEHERRLLAMIAKGLACVRCGEDDPDRIALAMRALGAVRGEGGA